MSETLNELHRGISGRRLSYGVLTGIEMRAIRDMKVGKGILIPERSAFVQIALNDKTYMDNHANSFGGIRKDLEGFARTLERMDDVPSVIFGITNEHIAKISSRYGFNTQRKPVDIAYRLIMKADYRNSAAAKRGKGMGKTMICWLTGEDFVNKFGSAANPVQEYVGTLTPQVMTRGEILHTY